jgi:glc operon protein GlcG
MIAIRTRRIIDEAGVDSVLAAAEEHARVKGYRVAITVVDRAGNVLALRRTPGAQVASSVVAVDKARTAAIVVRPSRDIEQQISSGRLGALALHGAAALTGGIPLRADGEVVGAIGTSGETPDQDESVSLAGAAVSFTTSEVPALTYEGARRVAETVGTVATDRSVTPLVAVVDAEGHLVYLWRPDAAQVASVGVATDKARTAAIYRRPSKDFEDQASTGRPSALHLARAVPLQGGMPLLEGGYVIGEVGVSGASSADEDQELAMLGCEALSVKRAATYIPRDKVHVQFQTGGLLLETLGYKLDAGRRTEPGGVELHDRETDIMQAVQGRATVVTGADEHTLGVGDVLVIPSGVPHQFVDVTRPFLYFVTKVRA